MKKFIFIFFLFILVIYDTKGVPYRWSEDVMNASSFDSYPYDDILDETYNQRKILTKVRLNVPNNRDTSSRTDGKIIFPTDEPDSQFQQYNLKPVPCKNSTFCENVPNYPTDLVEAALRGRDDLKNFTGVDMVPEVVHRINVQPEDIPLCQAKEQLIYPQSGENYEKNWLFIVNHGHFIQGVRVEKCGNENGECDLVEGAINGYSSTCKQKYIYRQLVAYSDGKVKPDIFRMPASCCCHFKMDGNISLRSGFSKKSAGSITKP